MMAFLLNLEEDFSPKSYDILALTASNYVRCYKKIDQTVIITSKIKGFFKD